MSTHSLLAAQRHAPATQLRAPQSRPHTPQCRALDPTSTQAPPQQRPALQLAPSLRAGCVQRPAAHTSLVHALPSSAHAPERGVSVHVALPLHDRVEIGRAHV
jgi:hypothetical protein